MPVSSRFFPLVEHFRMRYLKKCMILVLTFIPMLGLNAGCNNEQQIPLANVPPPPANFGKVVTDPKAPKGASPANVQYK